MKTYLRVVLIGPAYPLRGGIAQFNESLARALKVEGHSCELVSFYLQYPKVLFPGKSQFSKGPAPTDLSIHNWISSINPVSWLITAKKIRKLKPDLIVVRFWLPFMAPALGSILRGLRSQGVPIIGLVDNALPHEPRPFDRVLSTYFFKACDGFFSLSGQVADDLRSLAPGKPIDWSPHPIYDHFGAKISKDEARQKLRISKADELILFFGFVRPYKGLDLLIDAFGAVDRPNLKLIVAGEFYGDKDRYEKQLDRLGLTEKVVLHDHYIPDSEVATYFCAADLIAQTYRSATQSGVTQIAYHFERPMLVTKVGGLPEIVADGEVGFVVEPEPSAIAAAIERFYCDNLENQFSQAIARVKSRFSWKYFTQKIIQFADSVHS